jgi:hypothetical protein
MAFEGTRASMSASAFRYCRDTLVAVAFSLGAVACGSGSGGTGPDDVQELDLVSDVGAETGDADDADGEPDAVMDVPVEVDADAELDSPEDAPPGDPGELGDGGAEVGSDPDLDMSPDGSGSSWTGLAPFDWEFCPGAGVYVGDEDWGWSLEVTDDAVYCKMFDDVEWACCEGPIEPINPFTQPQRWNDRFELRVVAGTYPVPERAEASPIRVPVCIQLADGRQGVTSLTVMGSATGTSWGEGRTVAIEQPLVVGEHGWTAHLYATAEREDPLVLDGSHRFWGGSYLVVGDGEPVWGYGVQSCTHEGARRDLRTTIVHTRGEVVLRTRIGDSPASTEPGVFYEATGALDGVGFTQDDRWHLWYEVQHHHFVQNYLVLFAGAIGEVCGLEVQNAVPYQDEPVDELLVTEILCEGLAPPAFPRGARLEVTEFRVVNEADLRGR